VTHPGGCQGFFKKNYIPQNMVIAIVGDIEPQRTLQTLETYFGRLEPGEPEPIRTVEPKVPAPKTVTLYDPGQPWYLAGYPIPSIRDGLSGTHGALRGHVQRSHFPTLQSAGY
jgi:predicted Zn-dependent peptidase